MFIPYYTVMVMKIFRLNIMMIHSYNFDGKKIFEINRNADDYKSFDRVVQYFKNKKQINISPSCRICNSAAVSISICNAQKIKNYEYT